MIFTEQPAIEAKIKAYCEEHGIPLIPLEWKPLPFSGKWGISTSFFGTAAVEARSGKNIVVAQRAQEIAEMVKDRALSSPNGSYDDSGSFHVEVVKGYLNL